MHLYSFLFPFSLYLDFPPHKITIILPIFNDSDITALAKDKVYAHIRLDEMSVQQVYEGWLSFSLFQEISVAIY